jgi:hypothetical protein
MYIFSLQSSGLKILSAKTEKRAPTIAISSTSFVRVDNVSFLILVSLPWSKEDEASVSSAASGVSGMRDVSVGCMAASASITFYG